MMSQVEKVFFYYFLQKDELDQGSWGYKLVQSFHECDIEHCEGQLLPMQIDAAQDYAKHRKFVSTTNIYQNL